MSVDGARLSVLAVGKGKAVIGKRGGAVQECDALGDNQGRHPDSPKKRVATSWRINGEYAILRFKEGGIWHPYESASAFPEFCGVWGTRGELHGKGNEGELAG
jgi:hypothetical protein